MRFLQGVLGGLLILWFSGAMAEPINIEAPVTKVDLYLDYAEIHRQNTLELAKGTQEIVLKLPNPTLKDTLTIQFSDPTVVLKSTTVTQATRTEAEKLEDPIYQAIINKIAELEQTQKAQSDGKTKDRLLYLNIRKTDYFRKLNQPYKKLTLIAELSEAQKTQLTLSYETRSAGWVPRYLIQFNANNQAKILYGASIHQRTLESWNDVLLTLHTANYAQRDHDAVVSTQEAFTYSALRQHGRARIAKSHSSYSYVNMHNRVNVTLTNESDVPYLSGAMIFAAGEHKERLSSLTQTVLPKKSFVISIAK